MTHPTSLNVSGIRVEENGDDCVITWRWVQPGENQNWKMIASGIFVLFMLAIIVPFAAELMPILTPILCLSMTAVGYLLLTRFTNRTTLRATSLDLRIRQGPLPYPGNKKIERQRIKQGKLSVGVKKYRGSRRHRIPDGETYEVLAKIKGTQPELLLKGILERKQAEFIVQTVNAYWTDFE